MLQWTFDDFDFTVPYEVVEADRPNRFVLRTGPFGDKAPQLLEHTIETEGGQTVLRLVHSGFSVGADWDDEYEGVSSGWALAYAGLKRYLETSATKTRTRRLIMVPAKYTWSELAPYYRDESQVAKWLGAGSIGERGDPCRIETTAGTTITGRVLVRTPIEVLVSWDEIEGLIAFKAFPMGPDLKMIALDVHGFDLTPERADALAGELREALGRLAAQLVQ